MIGKYDYNSRYNIKNLKRRFNINNILSIPYCIGFADACIESRIVDFFIRNIDIDKNDVYSNFFEGVESAAKSILTTLGIEESLKNIAGGL